MSSTTLVLVAGFTAGLPPIQQRQRSSAAASTVFIVSPFDTSNADNVEIDEKVVEEMTATATNSNGDSGEFMELTWDNVETVLDEMRPFLIADGGNVRIQEIDGPVVRLELEVRMII